MSNSICKAMWILLLIFALACVALADPVSYEMKPGKTFTQPLPDMPLTEDQLADLKAGKPVCALVDGTGELKAGFMRMIVPYDPVTVWWVTQDIGHFHLTDPAYPASGSLTNKRRTFMPYVFDGGVCEVEGKVNLYQLLVLPLVSPRTYTLERYPSRDGFPWESAWKASKEMHCMDNVNPEFQKYRDKAVQVVENDGCWHIQPVPEKFRGKPEEAAWTYVEYYVFTNPGGGIGGMTSLANKATGTAMPNVHKNLLFQAGSWEEHLKKYHTPEELARYRQEREEFMKSLVKQRSSSLDTSEK